MLDAPPEYAAAMHGPHRRVTRIDSYDIDGNELLRGAPVLGGVVRADLTNRVSRTASFQLPAEYFPDTPDAPFSPYRAVVRIWSGIALGTGLEIVFPVFTGRPYAATLTSDGRADFRADDLAADVVAARFEQPERSRFPSAFATQLEEIQRLISEAIPQAVHGPSDVDPVAVPDLVWDEDRGQALDDMASAMGARWYTLGDGTFVVRRTDYTPTAPVQSFLDGPQGLMNRAQITRTRDGSANSVVVVSERLDGTPPVRVVARDNSPGSPTRFGGPFGRVVQVIKVQTPLSFFGANTLASSQLRAAVALTEQWSCDVVADHRIEPGDTVQLGYRGRTSTQVVDAVSYPLDTRTPMRLETRGTVMVNTPGV
jgi:hypothetical protein